jgi:AcrR family transcriptional regulator
MSLIHDGGNGADASASDASATAPKHRRRGEDLETALLDAAWEEFKAVGFYDLTIDAVAQRGGTSRTVLYRRWPGKVELVAAAARHMILKGRGPAPEPTGSLREDLIEMMRWANRTDVRTLIDATQHVGVYLAGEGLTFADIRQVFMQGRPVRSFSPIELAVQRGEVDPRNVTPRTASLPFDLFRHEVILNAQPLTDETIREIVDDIVLPLLTRKRDDGDGRSDHGRAVKD